MIHSVGIKSSFLSYPVIHSGLRNTVPPLLLEKGFIHHWCVCVHAKSLCNPMTVACQVPLSVGFSRQECWNGLPRPPPGDLPIPGIEPPICYVYLPWEMGSLPLVPAGKPSQVMCVHITPSSGSPSMKNANSTDNGIQVKINKKLKLWACNFVYEQK